MKGQPFWQGQVYVISYFVYYQYKTNVSEKYAAIETNQTIDSTGNCNVPFLNFIFVM